MQKSLTFSRGVEGRESYVERRGYIVEGPLLQSHPSFIYVIRRWV